MSQAFIIFIIILSYIVISADITLNYEYTTTMNNKRTPSSVCARVYTYSVLQQAERERVSNAALSLLDTYAESWGSSTPRFARFMSAAATK
jgi:hypothetical protein